MRKLLLILVFTFMSCVTGQLMRNPEYEPVNREFQPYVQSFLELSQGKLNEGDLWGLSINFKDFDDEDTTVGYCNLFTRSIYIDIDWWNKNPSILAREELVFHELGHCILHRHHTSISSSSHFWAWIEGILFHMGFYREIGYLEDYCPASYMHPYTLGLYCMNDHYDYYIKELYRTVKAPL